jgi:2-methylisocitrate lyase-like PEP mutase family enzyme
MTISLAETLQSRCELLQSLHKPGAPLLLPNAWDAASAKTVVEAGFPVVATTSLGVAAALGYEDDERAPADEMFAAAARIARSVEVPVTVDAEAGYGMEPSAVVAALRDAGAVGCNLEDTEHTAGRLRDAESHAEWLRAVRQAAADDGYPLVINARVDVFIWPYLAGAGPEQEALLPEPVRRAGVKVPETQEELVPEALRRARVYLEAGVDCVYPICLWEKDALRQFVSAVRGPVNVARMPEGPPVAELAALGVARVSWGPFLHWDTMARFKEQLATLDA